MVPFYSNYRIIILFSFTFFLASCFHDRVFKAPVSVPNGPGGKNNIQIGTLVINEFEATGSQFYNELVLNTDTLGGSDWVEIYNTTNDTITLDAGKWFLTDSLPGFRKFELPSLTILPHKYFVAWADGFDTTISQVHTNFKLSKNGEQLGLYYVKDPTDSFFVDQLSFGVQQSGSSFGRVPDGSTNWSFMNNPSPNAPNY